MSVETKLTPLAKKLLEALRAANGEWLTRNQIAERIGRSARLNPYDVEVLQLLVDQQVVEINKRETGVVREEYIYRAL